MVHPLLCSKHSYKIVGAEDSFLVGYVYFECRHCRTKVSVDRFYFYLSLQGAIKRG